MRRAAVAVATSLALLATASVAQAEQRYAATNGSGTACTQATPCLLSEAITKAGTGDEVIVTSGTYAVPATLNPTIGSKDVYIHGEFSGPMPRIEGSVSGNVPIGQGVVNGRLSYLDIENESTFAYAVNCPNGGRVDRVRATAVGISTAIGVIQNADCAVRDTVALASGPGSAALYGHAPNGGAVGIVRNVTAIAAGAGSEGVRSSYDAIIVPGSYTLDLKNVIADGAKYDLSALLGLEGPGNIVVSNSNFDTENAVGSAKITATNNQSAPPLFVNAAAGDYRPAAGSPTIDAGSTDQIGTLDLAGNPRTLGAAPDIGAYEFVPPPPAAADLQSLTITPKAFRPVNAGGAIVSARRRKPKVKVGTTVRYALTAAASVTFEVERALKGRRVGKKCKKPTPANRARKKCIRFKARKGGFTHDGAGGNNSFKFSGRVKGRALPTGRYRLLAKAGDSVKRARFRIVR